MKWIPRMTEWLLTSLVLLAAIYVVAPQQLGVSLYKLSLITTAAWVGYWIDRSLFPYARPDGYLNLSGGRPWKVQVKHNCIGAADVPVAIGYELIFAAAMLRRALIVSAAMLAASLGA